MRRGADVIYQATFFDGRWLGFADFLLRVETAERPRPVELRGRRHEARPPHEGERAPPDLLVHRPADADPGRRSRSGCTSPSAAARGRWSATGSPTTWPTTGRPGALLEAKVAATEPRLSAGRHVPEPVEHCDVCRWSEHCAARRRADDDLSLVAGITGRQRARARGARASRPVAASRALALPLDPPLDRRGAGALERVRAPGAPPGGGRGRGPDAPRAASSRRASRTGRSSRTAACSALPEPRPGDLFFDIEGDPFASTTGSSTCSACSNPATRDADGGAAFHAFWSLDADGRSRPTRRSGPSSDSIDLFMDRAGARTPRSTSTTTRRTSRRRSAG